MAQNRPQIGLALEGGGAKGFAHIGVLEWLEENRIPVDYIAGTSMGGLIGGLYAAGNAPAAMRELTRTTDWPVVIRGDTPFRSLAYRRKEDRLAFPNKLEFGLRKGITLPSGLNAGHQIGLILDRLTLPYSELATFDDLPIPFRCVAVEMVSGKEEVFEKGNLSFALRATMSIPGAFAPATQDGKVYTDGGILNNLPVDVLKRMGADIIIAVLLDTGPPDPEELGTLLGVLDRTISVVISANEKRNIEAADILLVADLKGYTGIDYEKGLEIADRGRDAAAKKANLLRRFELKEGAYRDHLSARAAKKLPSAASPQFVQVEGVRNPNLNAQVESALSRFAGQPMKTPEVERALTQIVGLGRFDRVGYDLVWKNGQPGIRVRATEKSHGPPFLNLAFEIDGSEVNDVRFRLNGRITFLDLGGFRSEWRNDFSFGGAYGYRTEYYHPFTAKSKWFSAARGWVIREPLLLYRDESPLAQYNYLQAGVGGDLGYNFSRFAELRVGQDLRWLRASLATGNPAFPNFDGRAAVTHAAFNYEGRDDVVVARRGLAFRSRFEYFSGVSDGIPNYRVLEGNALSFFPVNRNGSILAGIAGGSTFNATGILVPPFFLGSPTVFGAYGRNEILPTDYFFGTIGYLHKVAALPSFAGEGIYLTGFYQLGRAYDHEEVTTPQSGSAILVLKTIAGPAFLGASVGDKGRFKWYFGIGRVF